MSAGPSKCPFANALGVPGQGVHSFRVGGYAITDIVLTIIAAYLTSKSAKIPFVVSFTVWFVLGEILHVLFGVQTAFLTAIGVKLQCS
jgi:hypothetical protein